MAYFTSPCRQFADDDDDNVGGGGGGGGGAKRHYNQLTRDAGE